jgi:DNA-binding NarL/FixJ family response regulator
VIHKKSLPICLVVEPHPFFASFLRLVLARSGHPVVASAASASRLLLEKLAPGTIVFGLGACRQRPLEAIRRARSERPEAFIAVVSQSDDAAWKALARALGADIVLGPGANASDLVAAVPTPGKRQENVEMRRTSYINGHFRPHPSAKTHPG